CGRAGDREALVLARQIQRDRRHPGQGDVLDVGDLAVAAAGEAGRQVQRVDAAGGAAIEEGVIRGADDGVVARAAGDAVDARGGGDGEVFGLVRQVQGHRRRQGDVLDVGDLAVARAGEGGADLQRVAGTAAAVEQRVVHRADDGVVARTAGDAVDARRTGE